MLAEGLSDTPMQRQIESHVTNGLGYFGAHGRYGNWMENDITVQLRLGEYEINTGNRPRDVIADLSDLGRMRHLIFNCGTEEFIRFRGVRGVMRALRFYQGRNSEAYGHKLVKDLFVDKKDFLKIPTRRVS